MVTLALDHLLVWGDVDALAARIAAAVGAEPDDGGVHPGRGTRNAIFAARGGVALEVLGPDPAQDGPPDWAPRGDGALWWWAARTVEPIDATVEAFARLGLSASAPETGERVRPDGSRVGWTILDPVNHPFGTALPFVIRWDDEPPWDRPGAASELRDVRLVHPDPGTLRDVLAALGLAGLPVDAGEAPGLAATLAGPRGEMRFASR